MPTLRTNDIDTYYEISGRGEPLLLVHGLGSSTRNWGPQVDYFAERYRVITYDLRGHGRSDKPPGPYRMQTFAEDAACLLQSLDIPAAHVAGISMGGMIAFELAVRFPEMVKSLAVANCVPDMRAKSVRDYLEMWQRSLITKLLGVRRMGVVLSRRLFPKPEQGALRRLFVERWAENDKRAYRDALRAIFGWSVVEQLGEIRCPTLVIASDQDYWPLEEKQVILAQIADARLAVIADARHAVAVEKPEEFNRFLGEFLAMQEKCLKNTL